MSGARPMGIVASTELISVSSVFLLFHYMLWKAKLDLTALGEGLDSWSINDSFSTGLIAACGVMKTLLALYTPNQNRIQLCYNDSGFNINQLSKEKSKRIDLFSPP